MEFDLIRDGKTYSLLGSGSINSVKKIKKKTVTFVGTTANFDIPPNAIAVTVEIIGARGGNSYETTAPDPDASGTCFAAGTMIICYADGKYFEKPIETIQQGDIVLGGDGMLNKVIAPHKTKLGKTRCLMTFKDHSLYFTGEHRMWVRDGNFEGFGVHNINDYIAEHNIFYNGETINQREKRLTLAEYGIEYVPKPIPDELPHPICAACEYGTVHGWKTNKAIVAKIDEDMPLYSMILEGNETYFANGYLVTGFAEEKHTFEIRDLMKEVL